MPVDRFGKLFDPADRYAAPINRKPKRRLSRRLHWWLNGCLGLAALFLVFIFAVGIYGCSTRQPGQTDVREDWPVVLTASNTGDSETASVTVSSIWQIEWHCDKPLTVQVVGSSGFSIVPIKTGCNISQESGAVQISGPGTVHLRIISQGTWTVSIREPA